MVLSGDILASSINIDNIKNNTIGSELSTLGVVASKNYEQGIDDSFGQNVARNVAAPFVETARLGLLAKDTILGGDDFNRVTKAYNERFQGFNVQGQTQVNDIEGITGAVGITLGATTAFKGVLALGEKAVLKSASKKTAENILINQAPSGLGKFGTAMADVGFDSALAPIQEVNSYIDDKGQVKVNDKPITDLGTYLNVALKEAGAGSVVASAGAGAVRAITGNVDSKLLKGFNGSTNSIVDSHNDVARIANQQYGDIVEENGFVDLSKLDEETRKKAEKSNGAFVDEENNVIIRTPGLGELHGKLIDFAGTEVLVLDNKTSKPTARALKTKFKDGNKLIKFVDDSTIRAVKEGYVDATVSEEDIANYTPLSEISIDEAGNQIDNRTIGEESKIATGKGDSSLSEINRVISEERTDTQDFIKDKNKISVIQELGLLDFAKNSIENVSNAIKYLGNNKHVQSVLNMVKARTSNESVSNIYNSIFNNFNRVDSFNALGEAHNTEMLGKVFEKTNNPSLGGNTTYGTIKSTFGKAIKNSIAVKVASYVHALDSNTISSTQLNEDINKSFVKNIIKSALKDHLGIKEVNDQALDSLAESMVNDQIVNDVKQAIASEDIGINVTEQSLTMHNLKIKEDILNLAQSLSVDDIKNITNALSYTKKSFSVTDGKTNPGRGAINVVVEMNSYAKSVYQFAKKLASRVRTFDFDLFDKFLAEIGIDENNINSITPRDIIKKIGKINDSTGVISDLDLQSDGETLIEDIKKIMAIRNEHGDNAKITFNVMASGHRILYEGSFNPQQSKILRYILKSEDMKNFDLSMPIHTALVLAHINDVLKTNYSNIDEFKSSDLSDIKITSLEKALVLAQAKSIQQDIVNGKTSIKYVAAIDSTNNNKMSLYSMLGLSDVSLGLLKSGDDIATDKSKTTPSLIAKKLNDILGLSNESIDREIGKTIATPYFYLAGISSIVSNLVEGLFSKVDLLKGADRLAAIPDFVKTDINSRLESLVVSVNKSLKDIGDIIGLQEAIKAADDIKKSVELKSILSNKKSNISPEIEERINKELDQIIAYQYFLNGLGKDSNIKINDTNAKVYKEIVVNHLKEMKPINDSVRTVLSDQNIFPKKVTDLMGYLETAMDMYKIQFNRNINQRNISYKNAIRFMEDIVGKDKIDTLIGKNRALALDANSQYSLTFLVEELAKVATIDEQKVLSHRLTQSRDVRIPLPFGNESISVISFSGKAVYSSKSGNLFKNITSAGIFLPLYIQAIEANIAARVFKGENLFDATYGGSEIIGSALNANAMVKGIFENINAYELVSKLVSGANISTDSIGTDVETLIQENNKVREGRYDFYDGELQGHIDRINNLLIMNKGGDVAQRIPSIKEKIDEVNKSKQANKIASVNNYSVGSLDLRAYKADDSVTPSEVQKVIASSKSKDGNSIFEKLKDFYIDVRDKNIIVHLDDGFSSMNNGVYANERINFETSQESQFNVTSKTLILKSGDISPSIFSELVHESVHSVLDNDSSVASSSIINSLKKQIFDAFFNDGASNISLIKSDGTKTIVKPEDFTVGTINEQITELLSKLIINNMLSSNKASFAKIFNEVDNDLSQHAVQIEVVQTDGSTRIIQSLSDLRDFMKSKADDNSKNVSDYLAVVTKAVNQTINRPEIKKIINKNIDAFDDGTITSNMKPRAEANMLYSATTKIELLNKSVEKLSSLIESTGLDMFDTGISREALEFGLGIKSGMDSAIESISSAVISALEANEKGLGKEAVKARRVAGKATLLGINVWLDVFKKNVDGPSGFNVDTFLNDIRSEAKILEDGISAMILRNMNLKEHNEASIEKFTKVMKAIKLYSIGEHKVSDFRGFVKKTIQDNIGEKSSNFDNLFDVVEKLVAKERLLTLRSKTNNTKYSLNDVASFVNKDNTRKDYMINSLELFNLHRGRDTAFGINAEVNLSKRRRSVAVVSEENAKKFKKEDIIGYAVLADGKTKVAFIAKINQNYVVGAQESQIASLDVDEYVKGMVSKKYGDSRVYINPLQYNSASSAIDYDINTQIKRNVYMNESERLGREVAVRQFKVFKDNGIVVDPYAITDLENNGSDISMYKELPKNHPLVKLNGGPLFYNSKYDVYLKGSKGFDINQLTRNFGSANKIMSETIRWIIDITKGIKSAVLVYRPSSYINNIVSNTFNYMLHAPNPLTAISDLKWARTESASFRALINEYGNAVLKKDQSAIDSIEAKMKESPLYNAYKNGLFSTIRTDAFKTASYKELSIIGSVNNFDKSGSIADIMKIAFADPSHKVGNFFGRMFDETETIPKLAVYKNLLDSGMNNKQAMNYIQMAFPTYNNLKPILNFVDQFMPYTKYAVNYPKMMLFSLNKSMYRLMALNALLPMAAATTWEYDDEAEKHQFYQDNGFMYLPGIDVALSYNNWLMTNFFDIPTKSNELFLASVLAGFFKDPTGMFLPGVDLQTTAKEVIHGKTAK